MRLDPYRLENDDARSPLGRELDQLFARAQKHIHVDQILVRSLVAANRRGAYPSQIEWYPLGIRIPPRI